MFAVPTKITSTILVVALLLPGLARADINACFNFLKSQDYARAESEAQQILQDGNLNRIYERDAQLCLGAAYDGIGRKQDALSAFQRVEALSQTTLELAVAYNWLGLTYHYLDDLDQAEMYTQRALKACRQLCDKESETKILHNLADVVNDRGDLDRALQLHREVLIMEPEDANTLNSIALIHSSRKEYKQAIKLLRQAIAIDRRNGDTHATAQWHINLGDILRQAKQYSAAENELLDGLNAMHLVGDKGGEASACKNLGSLANAKDNPNRNVSNARQWMKKAEILYREIGDIETALMIANNRIMMK